MIIRQPKSTSDYIAQGNSTGHSEASSKAMKAARFRPYFSISRPQHLTASARLYYYPRYTHIRSRRERGRLFNSSLAYQQQQADHAETSIPTRETITQQTDTDEDVFSPIQQYRKLIADKTLRGDDHQTRIIHKLQDLHDQLKTYNPPIIPDLSLQNSIISRLFSRVHPPTPTDPSLIPRGLYLYGDVGTGKTMLMDLFYQTLPASLTRKRRVHFHAFMIDVHKRVHAAKAAAGYKAGDPIEPVARDLANDACVLCFDEFQVTDIADAMILRRLLESLLDYGVVCVITSNRHPDDLYKNGIQRSSFVPAIELLKSRFDVTDLDSGTDYRRIPRALSRVYYHPLNHESTLEINKLFTSLTFNLSDPVIKNRALQTWGRQLLIPESTSKVAKFTFMELCGKPFSAADYLEITKRFGTVFLLDVPKMGMDRKDLARRFITFIDACYESKTKLFATSEVPIFQVFSDEKNDGPQPISDHMRGVMDDLGLSGEIVGSSSIFTGEEEVFAFARACSRLVQMGSKQWAETAGVA